MIVDSSALIATARAEPDVRLYSEAIEKSRDPAITAANYLEASIVIDRAADPVVSRLFDQIVRDSGLIVEPVTVEHARIARAAYRDFGKGSGHSAGLCVGDCFAYALAKDRTADVQRWKPVYRRLRYLEVRGKKSATRCRG